MFYFKVGNKVAIFGLYWTKLLKKMKEKIYTFELDLNWQLLKLLSQLDRFDASWSSIEKKEGQTLKQLKTMATINSIGASTRIEGSKMSDKQVELLLKNIDISKLEDRDTQEVVGYSEALDLITESCNDIAIIESHIKSLHNILLKHSQKDSWHKGGYKKHVNAVAATFPDGSQQIIFKTTDPGIPTEDAMRDLIAWYESEKEVPLLIKIAAFVYDFLSIHPFQDGNGRLSRLLTTLLLMKSGYQWIQYVSFEHEIENNKKDYYRYLRNCQAQRPNEDITDWVTFFLKSLLNIQTKLELKLKISGIENKMSPKEKAVYSFIMNNPGCKTGDITKAMQVSPSTTKKILGDLMVNNMIEKHGNGAGTNYSIIG